MMPTNVRDALLILRDRVMRGQDTEPLTVATALPEPFDPVVGVSYALTVATREDGVLRRFGVVMIVGTLYEHVSIVQESTEQLNALNSLLAAQFSDVVRVFAPLHAKAESTLYVAPHENGGTSWKLEVKIPRDEIT